MNIFNGVDRTPLLVRGPVCDTPHLVSLDRQLSQTLIVEADQFRTSDDLTKTRLTPSNRRRKSRKINESDPHPPVRNARSA